MQKAVVVTETMPLFSDKVGRPIQVAHMWPGFRLTMATRRDDTVTATCPTLPRVDPNRTTINQFSKSMGQESELRLFGRRM